MNLTHRPRRNRQSQALRQMLAETRLAKSELIFPLFLVEGQNQKTEVPSMPGIYRYSLDRLLEEVEQCRKLGLSNFVLFPALPEARKNPTASEAYNPEGLYPRALGAVKNAFPDVLLMTDIALDPYSSDGHDGLVRNGQILNDETLEVLGKMALVQAEAGADLLGPSDMMDGRVGHIRRVLDQAGYTHTGIMSYTAKYASAFYGPFRDALDSAPKGGDKKTYQMDPANRREALREARLDAEEGADSLMVKPALPYLDVIRELSQTQDLPITAYNVSGEYAMLKAAGQMGWLDAETAMLESLLSIRRAGASAILTYFAKEAAALLPA